MTGDDDLRFGDIVGSDGSGKQDPSERLIELIRVLFIGILGLYMILYLVQSLLGVPVPFV